MKRRRFIGIAGAGIASLFVEGRCARAAGTFTAITEIKKLRIAGGPMAGAFVVAPFGYVNWYFANLGLYPYVSALKAEVKAYMDLYLKRMDPVKSNIADVLLNYSANPQSPTITKTQSQDSDDAYAGTFLSLASRFDVVFNDITWWNANKAKLKNIAYRNLLLCQKPSGLIRSLQDTTVKPEASYGYLMDNCEAYRGLQDFASRLLARRDADAAYYSAHATDVGNGIKGLFDASKRAFRFSDVTRTIGTNFYPDATAQVFPQAYTVAATGFGATQYDQAWSYLKNIAPGWENGGKDPFPWMILGYVAAVRGGPDRGKAVTQMRTLESLFKTDRAKVTINELGFYKRTADLLGVPA